MWQSLTWDRGKELSDYARFADVDRARQVTKALEAEVAKEKKHCARIEDAADAERKSFRAALKDAQRIEREMRSEMQSHAVALARSQALCKSFEARLATAGQQIADERAAHAAARTALAQAIAAVGQQGGKQRSKRGLLAG